MRVIGDDGLPVDLGSSLDVSGKADRDAGNLDAGNIVAWKTALSLAALAYKTTVSTGDISNDAVTLAKLQNASATARVLGRFTAGTGDYEEGDQTTVRSFLGLAALAYLATVGTSQIDNDAVTFAKFQNISAAGRVVGRKTTSTGAGDAEELAGSDIRALLGTLDADTLNGVSASTLQTNVLNAIRNGVGTAYDTLLEIYNQMATDESAVSGLITTVGGKGKLGVSADLSTASADAVHDHNLGTLDVVAQLYLKSDGSEVWVPFKRTSINQVTYYLPAAPTSGQYRSVVVPAIA